MRRRNSTREWNPGTFFVFFAFALSHALPAHALTHDQVLTSHARVQAKLAPIAAGAFGAHFGPSPEVREKLRITSGITLFRPIWAPLGAG